MMIQGFEFSLRKPESFQAGPSGTVAEGGSALFRPLLGGAGVTSCRQRVRLGPSPPLGDAGCHRDSPSPGSAWL